MMWNQAKPILDALVAIYWLLAALNSLRVGAIAIFGAPMNPFRRERPAQYWIAISILIAMSASFWARVLGY